MDARRGWIAVLLLVLAAAPARAGDSHPLRAEHPDLAPIGTEELARVYDRAVVVDVRNEIEYRVIHADRAVNLPLGEMTREALAKLRAPDDPRPLVFYCNGITCNKSYLAGEKARAWGFENVFVYDDGIKLWAMAHPDRTRFFGHPMTAKDVERMMAAEQRFREAALPPGEFIARALSGEYRVFDIRDRVQRNEIAVRLPGVIRVDLDRFISFLEQGKIPHRKILILDHVGKQVKWLDYYLREHGYTDYHFLSGGAREWQEEGYDPQGRKGS